MTNEQRDKLRAATEAAKKAAGGGRWAKWKARPEVGVLHGRVNDRTTFEGDTFVEVTHDSEGKARRIASYVAMADPDTVLALLDALDAADARGT